MLIRYCAGENARGHDDWPIHCTVERDTVDMRV
jgi:hypothetical protein